MLGFEEGLADKTSKSESIGSKSDSKSKFFHFKYKSKSSKNFLESGLEYYKSAINKELCAFSFCCYRINSSTL